jgi:CPA2 family monovalent cation:H+ antiporter-2
VWAVIRLVGATTSVALATGLCLAQIGEFSFVLAEMARPPVALIDLDVFKLMVSTTILTLFVTPFLVMMAPKVAAAMAQRQMRAAAGKTPTEAEDEAHAPPVSVVIVGFGPAGQAVAEALFAKHKETMSVVELNRRTASIAQRLGLRLLIGDATHADVMDEAGVATADVIAITVPDPAVTRAIVILCRGLAPHAAIVARARYHTRRWELEIAGAREVVDEEAHVGRRMAVLARRFMADRE